MRFYIFNVTLHILSFHTMTNKTIGIILHGIKYNDTSYIVDIFTESFGRSSYIIKGMRTRRGNVNLGSFHPLAIIEFEATGKSSAQLKRITEARLLYPLTSLPNNPFKTSIALFLGEFLYHSLKEEGTNLPLFSYLTHSIQWLDQCNDTNASNFHLVFLMRLSRFLGLYPNIEGFQKGDFFDLQNAEFTHIRPTHAHILLPEEAALISILMRMNYETMHLFAMNRRQRMRCLEIINQYYRLHIPNFPTLRSLEVLQALFD